MKKFVKIFSIVLAVLMLGSVMVACDKGNTEPETTAETAAPSITVEIIVKNASNKVVYQESVTTTKTTLGEVLDIYCATLGEDVECAFDESTGLLTKLGTVVPAADETFIAYDESQGKDKAFDSIKNQVLTNGQTIIVAVIKL